MPVRHHVYLVPGFFGFVNFGRLVYFAHVREYLDMEFHRRGMNVTIHRARVSPTSSIRVRAAELAEYIAETAPAGSPIHIVGHSTGGLDGRLLATPGVDLEIDLDTEALASRVKSVVSVATPHQGTPLASFFSSILGKRLLGLMSMTTVFVLREGRLPLRVMTSLASILVRYQMPGGSAEAALDHLQDELVGKLPKSEQAPFKEFFKDMGDAGLMTQLTPEGIDLFNASTGDRPGVAYGSVITRATPPSMRKQLGVRGLHGQASYVLYRFLYGQTNDTKGPWSPETRQAAERALATSVADDDNDGMVPTLSQVYGTVVHGAHADHLDVIGHFHDPKARPKHHDWLHSRSNFRRDAFEDMWQSIASFVAESRS